MGALSGGCCCSARAGIYSSALVNWGIGVCVENKLDFFPMPRKSHLQVTDIGLSVLPKDEPVELRNATLFQSHDGSLLLSTGAFHRLPR
eukprot:4878708-Amphidinium_carterae.1